MGRPVAQMEPQFQWGPPGWRGCEQRGGMAPNDTGRYEVEPVQACNECKLNAYVLWVAEQKDPAQALSSSGLSESQMSDIELQNLDFHCWLLISL